MKTIPVEDAVGTVLCHDITRIVPGRCKEPALVDFVRVEDRETVFAERWKSVV